MRSDARIEAENYKYERKLKNAASVSQLKKRLKGQYPGFDFNIKEANGTIVKSGHKHLGTVRDTYIDEE